MKKQIFKSSIFLLFMFSIYFQTNSVSAQTYFSDNFETGLSKWMVTAANWDTLFSTYCSGTHCVTDSRIGNYTYNSDPTITMSASLNLTGTAFPVLTFFHKYSLFEDGFWGRYDSVHAEISTNGGFNWSKIKSWRQSNRAWTYEEINLSGYKATNVKVRFHLSSHNGGGGSADGWYIDDVYIREYSTANPPVNLPFSDNFETGMGKWIAGGFNWEPTNATYSSGQWSATDSRIGNYIYGSDPTMTISGIMNLTATSLPILTFWHKYSLFEDGFWGRYDSIHIEVSVNGGFDWNTVQSWRQSNNAWTYEQINLSSYKTNSVKVRFHLSSHNGGGGSADGWYIDDVSIYDMNAVIKKIGDIIPNKYALSQNYPNPFNPTTNIRYDLPKNTFVKLIVFDMLGREVETLVYEKLNAGTYSVDWNASQYPSGVYFYYLQADSYTEVNKMILTK